MKKNPKLAVACRRISGVAGTTTTILEQTRRLSGLGWEVHAYGESLDSDRLREAGAVPHRLPRWPWGSRFKRRLFACLFDRLVRGEGFDLVCGHGDTWTQDVLSLHNCVRAAHEAVYATALPESSGVGWVHDRILKERRFRLLIANSGLMREELLRRYAIPPESVRVIHPGHDPSRFRPEDRPSLGRSMRDQLGLRRGELLVGLISSGDFVKRGVSVFLEALARLPPDLREITDAVVIGRETRLAPFRKLASETGLSERVRFLQPLPQVERCYHALDVYVHPALYEEFGQSVQEAMACGLPVLSSARTGASELFAGEAKSLLRDKPEPEGLSGQLALLLRNEAMRRRWGEEASRACRGNTWDRNFQLTLEAYRSLIG